MTARPFVSVIIVNYNGAHYMRTCLDALKAQSYPADCFEVIVSDNGSKDESLELLRSQYPWVKVLENGSNLGFASGNNVAIQATRGEYVLLLNNDTAPFPEWIENMVQVAEENPDAGIITGHLRLFYDQLALQLESETVVYLEDGRELGVQVYIVDSGLTGGVVQFLDGFWGWERDGEGKRFRWSQSKALLGIPLPLQPGPVTLRLRLAAPRRDNSLVNCTLSYQGQPLARWQVSGLAEEYSVTLSEDVWRDAVAIEQNTGSIVFFSGAGRDRGTYVRNSEVYFEEDRGQYGQVEEVFAGCGASLLLRRAMLEAMGSLDDDLFMYYEDTDLSWRARLQGWKVLYAPKALVRHVHCGTTKEWSPFFIYLTERNRLAVVFKNGSPRQVSRVWGGYFLKVIRLGLQGLWELLRRRPGWRATASQVKMHMKVSFSLLKWLPALLQKRARIQNSRKTAYASIESWFARE